MVFHHAKVLSKCFDFLLDSCSACCVKGYIPLGFPEKVPA